MSVVPSSWKHISCHPETLEVLYSDGDTEDVKDKGEERMMFRTGDKVKLC